MPREVQRPPALMFEEAVCNQAIMVSRSMGNSMREIARPSLHLCVPRTARSLSPRTRGANIPLIRCLSDREETVAQPKMERSISVTTPKKDTLALLPTLTPSQVSSIRRSWKHVNTKGLTLVIQRCFQRSESSSESVGNAFRKVSSTLTTSSSVRTILDHTKYVLNLFDRIIDGNQDVELELKRIGAQHAFLEDQGVGVKDLERLGEYMAESLFRLDGIRQSKETTKAWTLLIAEIIDHIRDGFETEIRFKRRRTSFQPGSNSRKLTEISTQLRVFSMKSKKKKDHSPILSTLPRIVMATNINKEGNTVIHVHAKPGAKQSQVTNITDEEVSVSLAAPPREGQANMELISFMASVLGIRKTELEFDKGAKSRTKLLVVQQRAISIESIQEKLRFAVQQK